MSIEHLRLLAFCAYLAAWAVFAVGAIIIGIPVIRRQTASHFLVPKTPVLIGTVLQIASPLAITAGMGEGPLRPQLLALIGVSVLAPFAAALFLGVLFSMPRGAGQESIVTRGVYAWIRHPLYLAFLAILVATGLLASAGLRLAVAIVIYLLGSELRIASEEQELSNTFHAAYDEYCLRTRWRYLPGVR
jgi:protein-S-isoprenylcysteine O-methyltransferase Ste14